jgi:glycosyltransferase involved in cell wall biosynthesis
MHVAQFVQRYPPALGGSEAYTRRLCEYLAACGDAVRVWTTSAIELSEMWGAGTVGSSLGPRASCPHVAPAVMLDGSTRSATAREAQAAETAAVPGEETPALVGGVRLHRYPPLHFPTRRYVLKALSLLPHRGWQCLSAPCNPVCPAMWYAANRFDGPLDAIHATAFPYSFPIACGLRLARRRGVPFLLTPFLHLGDPRDPRDQTRRQYTKPHLRWLLKQADRVFVQTQAERDATVSLGVPAGRVVLQGLAVDASECTGGNREATRAAWDVQPGEVVIGHLANNSAEKGTVDLLRATEQTWAAGHRFRVVLAGPEMPGFRAFWEPFARKDRVTRLGVLGDEEKRDFFAGIDCFALPSRCDSFGLVLLEAWANGKPNLVYRAGGPAELVRHEIDGLQAACGDVTELAALLGRLIADAPMRRLLGANGQARVATEFVWRDKLELVRDTIREAVTSAAAQRNPRRRWFSAREAEHPSPRPHRAAPARTSAPR